MLSRAAFLIPILVLANAASGQCQWNEFQAPAAATGDRAGTAVAAQFGIIAVGSPEAMAGRGVVDVFNAAFASRGGAPYQGASLAMSFAGMHLITSAPTPAPKPAPTPAPFFTALSDGGMSGGTVAALVLAASALACCGGLLVGTRWQKVMAKYRQRTCWGCLRRAWHAHRSPKDSATADRIKAGGTAEAVAVANPLKVEL